MSRSFPFLIQTEGYGEKAKHRENGKERTKRKISETPFSANKLTFHQVLVHFPFTFIGLNPCSITKVLTGADYSNKSWGRRGGVTQRTGMQKGLPEGQ